MFTINNCLIKRIAFVFGIFIVASCQKSEKKLVTSGTATGSNAFKGEVTAKINGRQWQSAAKKAADSNAYLAAINSGKLQIKTFGLFTDSLGTIGDEQLGIYIDGVTDTGTYTLSMSNYIVYNQLSDVPKYFSSQLSNSGTVHITNLSSTAVSGTFQCTVEQTSGTGSLLIKEGTFTNVIFQ
jgi:hypothetical protein